MPIMPKHKRRPWEPQPVLYNKMAGQGRLHGGNQKFYKSKPWRKCREIGLIEEPWCCKCGAAADVRDHKRPINPIDPYDSQGGRYPDPLDMSNHQSMCQRCHNRKSAKERHGKA